MKFFKRGASFIAVVDGRPYLVEFVSIILKACNIYSQSINHIQINFQVAEREERKGKQ